MHSDYVEQRNRGYYLAGTRISLDSVVYSFKEGQSPEAILEDFHLSDPALQRMGHIVRAADVKGQESVAPEGLGLRAIAQGFAALGLSDDERLRHQFPMYDALYAYVRQHAA